MRNLILEIGEGLILILVLSLPSCVTLNPPSLVFLICKTEIKMYLSQSVCLVLSKYSINIFLTK